MLYFILWFDTQIRKIEEHFDTYFFYTQTEDISIVGQDYK